MREGNWNGFGLWEHRFPSHKSWSPLPEKTIWWFDEKYQLVILGELQTRVTYWYTHRSPNTHLPTWVTFTGLLFAQPKIHLPSYLGLLCTKAAHESSLQMACTYFYSYLNHPPISICWISSNQPLYCLAELIFSTLESLLIFSTLESLLIFSTLESLLIFSTLESLLIFSTLESLLIFSTLKVC